MIFNQLHIVKLLVILYAIDLTRDFFMSFNFFDFLPSLSNLIGTGYNIYQDQRNFNYTKELQQELFARDDTAMQRRMQDYKNAGINPLMALGSSGAGVSSITPSGESVSSPTLDYNAQRTARLQNQLFDIKKEQEEEYLKGLKEDNNKKKVENDILSKQYENMKVFGYYPYSSWGKGLIDLGNIISTATNGNVNPFQPFSLPFDIIKNNKDIISAFVNFLGTPIITSEKLLETTNNVKQKVEDITQKGFEILGKPVYEKDTSYKIKGMTYPALSSLDKVRNDFNKYNTSKTLQLHFIRAGGNPLNPRGYLKLYDKKTKKYYSPNFTDLNSIIRFLNYGSTRY